MRVREAREAFVKAGGTELLEGVLARVRGGCKRGGTAVFVSRHSLGGSGVMLKKEANTDRTKGRTGFTAQPTKRCSAIRRFEHLVAQLVFKKREKN